MSLSNKKIVVVGGSSGIGLATAKRLALGQATVVIGSRSAAKLKHAQAEIGRSVEAFAVDIKNDKSVAEFFRSVGNFDHLVISAAPAVMGSFVDLDLDAAQDFFNGKFWGAYRVARAAVPLLSPDGSITFVSGAASQRGTPGLAVGGAINAALEALGRTLAVELTPIRVNSIAPGLIDTPVWGDLVSEEQKQEIFAGASAKMPVRHIGRAEEIAHAVQYLIENTFTTGSTLFVEGGALQV